MHQCTCSATLCLADSAATYAPIQGMYTIQATLVSVTTLQYFYDRAKLAVKLSQFAIFSTKDGTACVLPAECVGTARVDCVMLQYGGHVIRLVTRYSNASRIKLHRVSWHNLSV